MEYRGFGTIILEVSKLIEAQGESEAVHNLLSEFSTFGIEEISLNVKTSNGEIYNIEIHDHDISWHIVEQIINENVEKATKQMT